MAELRQSFYSPQQSNGQKAVIIAAADDQLFDDVIELSLYEKSREAEGIVKICSTRGHIMRTKWFPISGVNLDTHRASRLRIGAA